MRGRIRNPKRAGWLVRKARVARRLERSARTRLTVYRSSKHIYALLVDESGRTLTGISTRTPSVRARLQATGNVEAAKAVGLAIAELARRRGIERVVFDRNGFHFHGRVRALAEAAREGGLEF
jgi:large subunit ribosomal protein L18